MAIKNSKRKSNKGFSLMELLVVIAIMAIVTTMSFGSVYLSRKASLNGAKKDLHTELMRTKGFVTSHDKARTRIRFYVDSSDNLVAVIEYKDDESSPYISKYSELIGKNVVLEFADDKGSKTTVTKTKSLCVYFDKRSGKVTEVKTTMALEGGGSLDAQLKYGESSYGTFTVHLSKWSPDKTRSFKLYYENATIN